MKELLAAKPMHLYYVNTPEKCRGWSLLIKKVHSPHKEVKIKVSRHLKSDVGDKPTLHLRVTHLKVFSLLEQILWLI